MSKKCTKEKLQEESPEFLLQRIKALERQLGMRVNMVYSGWEYDPTLSTTYEKDATMMCIWKQVNAIKDFVGIELIYSAYTPAKTEIKIKKKVRKSASKRRSK